MAIIPRYIMDDDIDVLTHGNSNHDYSDDNSFTRGDNLSNMHITFTRDEKDGSLHALTTAYSDLKKRYRELETKNNVLYQTIKDMEQHRVSSRPVSGNFGGAAGPSSASPALGAEMDHAQMKAEFSFAQSLERQLLRAKANISRLETEKLQWQQKAEAFDRDLKRIQTLVRDKDRKIEQLESDLKARGHTHAPRPNDSMLRFPREDSNETAKLHDENKRLREEMEQLQSFNESLQSRCVALEQKDTTTAQAQVSMSLSQQEEKFILEQMEKYRKMISDLKQQVLQQGDMLKRQKEAIKKLIAEVQAYRSKQSSLPYREPSEGASFSQPMKDGYTYGYGFHPGLLPSGQVNDFQDMHEARLGMNTFQTLNPQTLEHGKRQTFISRPVSEPPDRNNYVKNISPGHKDRDTNTGDLYRGKMTSDDRSRRVSPTNSGNQRISSASDQSVDTGARRKIPQTTQENSPDLRLYENNIATPRNPEPSRGQGHRGVKLEDPQSTYGNFKLSQTMTLEDDYVNIGELDPNRREDQGRAERPTGSVITSEMNVDRKRQPVSSEIDEENTVTLNSQLCPVCRREYPNISMEDFQMHVISCMDSQDDNELVTMQNIPASTGNGSENRICPMCDATFPGELPQSEFERHVQEHFGEDPITDRFEVLRP